MKNVDMNFWKKRKIAKIDKNAGYIGIWTPKGYDKKIPLGDQSLSIRKENWGGNSNKYFVESVEGKEDIVFIFRDAMQSANKFKKKYERDRKIIKGNSLWR